VTDDERVIGLCAELFPTLRTRLDRTDEMTCNLRQQLSQVRRLVGGSDPADQAAAQITAARELFQQYTSRLLSMWLSPTLWRQEEKAEEEE
jgi:hypothetical protein